MTGRRILLRGTVEGVGMRPAIARFAAARGLSGWVRNGGDAVECVFFGPEPVLEAACRDLASSLPPRCRPETPWRIEAYEADPPPADFRIMPSAPGENVNLLTPPDLAPCPHCLAEMNDPANRRFGFAFISCGDCGPRASTVRQLPYDRAATAWADFPLCENCRREYGDAADRRFHIQSISCPVCGPKAVFLDREGHPVPGDPLAAAAALIDAGGILAMKGVGMFLLLADCRNAAALRELRRRKRRPEKPLAVMARHAAEAELLFDLDPAERELLTSPEAPIVLLRWRRGAGVAYHAELLSPDDPETAGVMLPSSPLHALLAARCSGAVLAATSANGDAERPAAEAADLPPGLADGILTHDRVIEWRYDDSVAAVNGGRPQYWRRGRGAAPDPLGPVAFDRRILAVGGMNKNTYAVTAGNRLFVSPHQGDTGDVSTAAAMDRALARTLALLTAPPEIVAVDAHPDYPSTRFGEQWAAKLDVPVVRVPHHYAHALAALAEAGFDRALALVFDGSGLGPDGTIWGAELLDVSRHGGFRRAHFSPVPLPGGDAAVLAPKRQLAGRAFAAGLPVEEAARLCGLPPERAEQLYAQCRSGLNAPLSGSAGRLFDAFAALCGLAPETITWEGQAAVRLEAAARRESAALPDSPPRFETRIEGEEMVVHWDRLWREAGDLTPLGFHREVARAAAAMARFGRESAGRDLPILLTGGCFQNRLLTALTAEELARAGMRAWTPSLLPPNDASISVGQIFWAGLHFVISGVHYTTNTL